MDTELLSQLISIPSTYPKEGALADCIETWLKKQTTCTVVRQKVDDGRINLHISKGTGKKSILLSGHLDTVPVVEGWSTDPLKPIEKEDKLYGLGAWDMKAGLSVILHVLKTFEPKNFTLKAALTVDEENYSVGVHKMIDSGFCDDVAFVIVPEPGFIHGEKGIAIGRSGRATYIVKIKGVSAHGSFPEKGTNAIDEASLFLQEIQGIKLSDTKDLGSSIIFPRAITSEAKGFSVPDECVLELDSKLVYPDRPDDVLEKLKSVATKLVQNKKIAFMPDITFKVRPTPFCAPYMTDTKNAYIQLAKKSVEKIVKEAVLFYRNSVADECIFADRLHVPVVTIGPSGENAHKPNEYVHLGSLKNVEEIYLTLLHDIDITQK